MKQSYRFTTLITALIFGLAGCSEQASQVNDGSEDLARLSVQAKSTVQAFGSELQAELQAGMAAGGPLRAMDVCNIKAPQLAESVSAAQGMAVKRVSLKPRNAETGVANTWQTAVLNDFEVRKAQGELADDLVYAQIVESEFRYMHAIATKPVCLACHGQSLAPSVTAKLAELYPHDLATGYREGDLRGAFVVTQKLLK